MALVTGEESEVAEDAPPRRRGWWQALLLDPSALIALSLLLLIVLAAIFAPLLAPYNPTETTRNIMQVPIWHTDGEWAHILGTDGQGRDILSRILFGARWTLLIGLIAVGLGGIIGSTLGLISSMYSRIDSWLMRFNDIMLSFPAILLGLALVSVMGPGVFPIILALSIAAIPDTARIARSLGLGVMEQEFIEAGRAIGLPELMIFRKYLLRNCISSIMIYLSLRFGQIILIGAALSFLGLGIRPPTPELGMMAASGRDYLLFAPHIVIIPSIAIFVIVLCTNVAGDALRDILDPRM